MGVYVHIMVKNMEVIQLKGQMDGRIVTHQTSV